jgi:hypothetical protein
VNEVWQLPTDHFDPNWAQSGGRSHQKAIPLEEVLVEGSSYSRKKLKQRLYDVGLKQRCCELCGQGEDWKGARMSLILDHVNGVPNDNRLPNLRIVCPNCAATLDTHCGKKNRIAPPARECAHCGGSFVPRFAAQHYCSRACGVRHTNRRREPEPAKRQVERPGYEQLVAEIDATSYLAVGRKYGVSDNAVRKWVRAYEYEQEMALWRQRNGRDDVAA